MIQIFTNQIRSSFSSLYLLSMIIIKLTNVQINNCVNYLRKDQSKMRFSKRNSRRLILMLTRGRNLLRKVEDLKSFG